MNRSRLAVGLLLLLPAAQACGRSDATATPTAAAPSAPAAPSTPPAPPPPATPPTPAEPPPPPGWPAGLPVLPGGTPQPMAEGMAQLDYAAPPSLVEPAYLARLRQAGWSLYGRDRTDRRSMQRNFSVCRGTDRANVQFTPHFNRAGQPESISIMTVTLYLPALPATGCPPP